jgi:poly(A) polymerase
MMSGEKDIREFAFQIVSRLQTAGHVAFWVGGCVRDQILGREPQDYDVATSAKPEEVEKLFSRTIPVGRQFGVVIVMEQGHEFQVATFRAEAEYQDGRRPGKVTFADAKADASRRDFTINGLFYDPVTKEIYDWFDGEADIRAKILRTIGTPEERFNEDHLRMLRAVRFAAQLGFEMDDATFGAIKKYASKIQGISAERIREELMKLFRSPHAARGLDLLRDSGLLQEVLPEIAAMITCEQSADFHPEGSVYNHVRLMLETLPADASETLPWAVLLHDVAKPVTATKDEITGSIHFYGHEKVGAEMAETILDRLRFPRKQTEEIKTAVLHHMQFKDVRAMRKATLRRMMLRETFPLEMQLHRLDCLGSHRDLGHYQFMLEQEREFATQPQVRPPLLTGEDLKAMGIEPGPAMGKLLAELREHQLQDEITNADEAKEWVISKYA